MSNWRIEDKRFGKTKIKKALPRFGDRELERAETEVNYSEERESDYHRTGDHSRFIQQFLRDYSVPVAMKQVGLHNFDASGGAAMEGGGWLEVAEAPEPSASAGAARDSINKKQDNNVDVKRSATDQDINADNDGVETAAAKNGNKPSSGSTGVNEEEIDATAVHEAAAARDISDDPAANIKDSGKIAPVTPAAAARAIIDDAAANINDDGFDREAAASEPMRNDFTKMLLFDLDHSNVFQAPARAINDDAAANINDDGFDREAAASEPLRNDFTKIMLFDLDQSNAGDGDSGVGVTTNGGSDGDEVASHGNKDSYAEKEAEVAETLKQLASGEALQGPAPEEKGTKPGDEDAAGKGGSTKQQPRGEAFDEQADHDIILDTEKELEDFVKNNPDCLVLYVAQWSSNSKPEFKEFDELQRKYSDFPMALVYARDFGNYTAFTGGIVEFPTYVGYKDRKLYKIITCTEDNLPEIEAMVLEIRGEERAATPAAKDLLKVPPVTLAQLKMKKTHKDVIKGLYWRKEYVEDFQALKDLKDYGYIGDTQQDLMLSEKGREFAKTLVQGVEPQDVDAVRCLLITKTVRDGEKDQELASDVRPGLDEDDDDAGSPQDFANQPEAAERKVQELEDEMALNNFVQNNEAGCLVAYFKQSPPDLFVDSLASKYPQLPIAVAYAKKMGGIPVLTQTKGVWKFPTFIGYKSGQERARWSGAAPPNVETKVAALVAQQKKQNSEKFLEEDKNASALPEGTSDSTASAAAAAKKPPEEPTESSQQLEVTLIHEVALWHLHWHMNYGDGPLSFGDLSDSMNGCLHEVAWAELQENGYIVKAKETAQQGISGKTEILYRLSDQGDKLLSSILAKYQGVEEEDPPRFAPIWEAAKGGIVEDYETIASAAVVCSKDSADLAAADAKCAAYAAERAPEAATDAEKAANAAAEAANQADKAKTAAFDVYRTETITQKKASLKISLAARRNAKDLCLSSCGHATRASITWGRLAQANFRAAIAAYAKRAGIQAEAKSNVEEAARSREDESSGSTKSGELVSGFRGEEKTEEGASVVGDKKQAAVAKAAGGDDDGFVGVNYDDDDDDDDNKEGPPQGGDDNDNNSSPHSGRLQEYHDFEAAAAAKDKNKADAATEEEEKADAAIDEEKKVDAATEDEKKSDATAEADAPTEEEKKADAPAEKERKEKVDAAAKKKRKEKTAAAAAAKQVAGKKENVHRVTRSLTGGNKKLLQQKTASNKKISESRPKSRGKKNSSEQAIREERGRSRTPGGRRGQSKVAGTGNSREKVGREGRGRSRTRKDVRRETVNKKRTGANKQQNHRAVSGADDDYTTESEDSGSDSFISDEESEEEMVAPTKGGKKAKRSRSSSKAKAGARAAAAGPSPEPATLPDWLDKLELTLRSKVKSAPPLDRLKQLEQEILGQKRASAAVSLPPLARCQAVDKELQKLGLGQPLSSAAIPSLPFLAEPVFENGKIHPAHVFNDEEPEYQLMMTNGDIHPRYLETPLNFKKRAPRKVSDFALEKGELNKLRLDETQPHFPYPVFTKKNRYCTLHYWATGKEIVTPKYGLVRCSTCGIYLCPICFALFHKVEDIYGQKKHLKKHFFSQEEKRSELEQAHIVARQNEEEERAAKKRKAQPKGSNEKKKRKATPSGSNKTVKRMRSH